jgi:hypothetical protein
MTRLDRPWHRPGAVWYALRRLPGLLHPPVRVYEPPAGSLSVLRDLPVEVRDGVTLRVNVVLPAGGERFPVLLSAHPYGKDNLPKRRGRRYRVSVQYRVAAANGTGAPFVPDGLGGTRPGLVGGAGLRGGQLRSAWRRNLGGHGQPVV